MLEYQRSLSFNLDPGFMLRNQSYHMKEVSQQALQLYYSMNHTRRRLKRPAASDISSNPLLILSSRGFEVHYLDSWDYIYKKDRSDE